MNAPVEVPFEGEDFDLDSFLDGLKPQTRMKVVREMSGEAAPMPVASRPVAPAQTATGGPRMAEKVLLAALVAPVLLALYLTVLLGHLAQIGMDKLVKFTKEKMNAGRQSLVESKRGGS